MRISRSGDADCRLIGTARFNERDDRGSIEKSLQVRRDLPCRVISVLDLRREQLLDYGREPRIEIVWHTKAWLLHADRGLETAAVVLVV